MDATREYQPVCAPVPTGDAPMEVTVPSEPEFTPDYLSRPMEGSLAELKEQLKPSSSLEEPPEEAAGEEAPSLSWEEAQSPEEPALEEKTLGATGEDWLRELDLPFDLDEAFEEIRRSNALFGQTLRPSEAFLQEDPLADLFQEDKADIPEAQGTGEPVLAGDVPAPAKQEKDYLALHRWTGVYRGPHREETVSAGEVMRLHRKDYDDQLFRPSFITVVGEAPEEPEGRTEGQYHNQNWVSDFDQPRSDGE